MNTNTDRHITADHIATIYAYFPHRVREADPKLDGLYFNLYASAIDIVDDVNFALKTITRIARIHKASRLTHFTIEFDSGYKIVFILYGYQYKISCNSPYEPRVATASEIGKLVRELASMDPETRWETGKEYLIR